MNFKEWWPNNIIENNCYYRLPTGYEKTLLQDKHRSMFSDNSKEARVLFSFLLLKPKLYCFQVRVLIYIFPCSSKKKKKKPTVVTYSPLGEILWWEFYYLKWQVGLIQKLFKKKSAYVLRPFICFWLFNPMDCSPLGSSVHGISQAKNTGVGYHFLFQGIFLTQGSNPHSLRLLHWQAPGKLPRKGKCLVFFDTLPVLIVFTTQDTHIQHTPANNF